MMTAISILVLLSVAAGLIIFTMLSRVRVEFLYSRVEHDDLLRVKVRALYGLIRYKYEVPIIDWSGIHKGVSFIKESINQNDQHMTDKNHGKINKHIIIKQFEQYNELLKHTIRFNRWFTRTLRRMHCTSMEWTTKIGVGEAPDTAIAVGLLWGIKSSMLGYVFRLVQLHEMPVVNVQPLFNQVRFEMRISSQIEIRMVTLLTAGLQLFIRIIRAKKGLRYIFRTASWTQ